MLLSKKYLFSPELRQLARYGMVISHPARVLILRTLRRQGVASYQDLVRLLPLESATVSDHLRTLERAPAPDPGPSEKDLLKEIRDLLAKN